jgi:hypothetical protein
MDRRQARRKWFRGSRKWTGPHAPTLRLLEEAVNTPRFASAPERLTFKPIVTGTQDALTCASHF